MKVKDLKEGDVFKPAASWLQNLGMPRSSYAIILQQGFNIKMPWVVSTGALIGIFTFGFADRYMFIHQIPLNNKTEKVSDYNTHIVIQRVFHGDLKDFTFQSKEIKEYFLGKDEF